MTALEAKVNCLLQRLVKTEEKAAQGGIMKIDKSGIYTEPTDALKRRIEVLEKPRVTGAFIMAIVALTVATMALYMALDNGASLIQIVNALGGCKR